MAAKMAEIASENLPMIIIFILNAVEWYCCTDGGEIWHRGAVPSSVPKFTIIGAKIRV